MVVGWLVGLFVWVEKNDDEKNIFTLLYNDDLCVLCCVMALSIIENQRFDNLGLYYVYVNQNRTC